MTESNKINHKVHSEELNDVISRPPSWLLKSGISFVFFITLSLLGMSYFIHIPERVKSSVTFDQPRPIELIKSSRNTRGMKILIKNGDTIPPNQILAIIDNDGNYQDVLQTLHRLKETNQKNDEISIANLKPPSSLNLGSLQTLYVEMHENFENLKLATKKVQSKRFTNSNERNNKILISKVKNLTTEYKSKILKLQSMLADDSLYRISDRKLRTELISLMKQNIALLESSISSLNLATSNGNEIGGTHQEAKHYFILLNQFISKAENWKNKFVLTNRTKGKIIIDNAVDENGIIVRDQPLFRIYPLDATFIAQLAINEDIRLKFKLGQEVKLNFIKSSTSQLNQLSGKIAYIAGRKNRENLYIIKVAIYKISNKDLQYFKTIKDLEVIIKDGSMLEMIWSNILKSKKI